MKIFKIDNVDEDNLQKALYLTQMEMSKKQLQEVIDDYKNGTADIVCICEMLKAIGKDITDYGIELSDKGEK